MLEIIVSKQAEQDLLNIWSYTNKQWDEKQADAYLDRLNEGFELIAENPNIAVLRKEVIKPVYIYPFEHHLMVYVVDETRIKIIRVLHESMNVSLQLDE